VSGSVVDADSGRVALTRRELDVLRVAASGEELPAAARDALTQVGALDGDEVALVARPIVHALRTVVARGVLRRWDGGAQPPVEVLVSPSGVVVLPGGGDPDAVQEVAWRPQPTSVARMIAERLGAPLGDLPAPIDATPRRWSDLVDLASDPSTGIGLADLRWAPTPSGELATVMVLAWHRDGGIVEVRPADGGHVVCEPVHPLVVWTGLARLSAAVRGLP
jgi:hypothetical protein